jgi:hypothetical protein
MSELKVNKVTPRSGTTVTLGDSGDTITIPSGATIDTSGATLTLPTTIEVDTIEPKTATTLTLGASGDTITIPSGATITNSGTATGFGGAFESQLLHVRDEKSANTAGGSSSATTDNQRDLNTVVINQITGASLSSNVITLPAGTFFIIASSPSNRGGTNRAHLFNTADSSIQLLGTSENTQTADTTPTRSFINGRFTIAAQKTFTIRHYTTSDKADNGLGIQANDGRTEVYTDVQIWKVA